MARIDAAYPGTVIFIELPTISLSQRMQLWAIADVAVFTPLREGVNTFPLEAVYASRDGPCGITILLSEFASCARVLNGALRVNPWNTEMMTEALELSCMMSTAERHARHMRDVQFLLDATASVWAERFIVDLLHATNRPEEAWTAIGFGLAGFRRVGWGSTFRALDTTEVLAAYRRARRRAIFLDWGGTLIAIETSLSTTLVDYYRHDLPQTITHCLQELAADPSNLLMVISGQERSRVDDAFRGIPGMSLAAEHGFHFRLGSFPGVRRVSAASWQQLVEDFDLSWKETAKAILEAYTTRTNGAVIQDKGSSLTWKYDDVDPEFASMQVKELHQHLQGVLAECPVEVTIGKGYLEVRPRGINKGVMLDHMISLLYNNSGGVDFVLCIGDDSADEYMFQALQARFGAAAMAQGAAAGGGGTAAAPGPHAPAIFTTVVGRKPSAAHYFLNDADEVLELCQSLRLHSTRANRNRSMGDLQRLHSERTWAGKLGGVPAQPRGGGLDWSRARQPWASIAERSTPPTLGYHTNSGC